MEERNRKIAIVDYTRQAQNKRLGKCFIFYSSVTYFDITSFLKEQGLYAMYFSSNSIIVKDNIAEVVREVLKPEEYVEFNAYVRLTE